MIVLGINGAFSHDPSAALLIDGKLIAAVEEERFTRLKHAENQLPLNAIEYCLRTANMKPSDVNIIAYPWSSKIYHALKWRAAKRILKTRPLRAYKMIINAERACRNVLTKFNTIITQARIPLDTVKVEFIEHHIAHAASAYYLSGFDQAAVLSIDGSGELTSCLFGEGNNGAITKRFEIVDPDSLGRFYSTVTAYLGFQPLDGEYKLMGMAPFGDPNRINMSHIIYPHHDAFRVHDDYVWPIRRQRIYPDTMIPKKMVRDWGPERTGDDLHEPYIHIAAATQKVFEDITFHLIEHHLKDILKKNGTLCFAGGCALNVSLNRKLIQHPLVKELWVQPAAHDAGTSLGAAAYAAHQAGDTIEPMRDAYLGPEYTNERIQTTLEKHPFKYEYKKDIIEDVSALLANGKIVGWFQGRMEYGPRALGNRSILGHPGIPGMADRINEIIKFRETWRPFCPSVLPEFAEEILNTKHPSPFMTFSFDVNPAWRKRISQVVHVDGTARPQIVDKTTNPRFYNLVWAFYKKTHIPVVINTSLNRRGEPMICSPDDALLMFKESGLEYLAIGDFWVVKQ